MSSCDGVIASFPRAGRGWLCRMVEWTVRDSFGLTGELSPSALEESFDYSERRVPRLIEGFNRGEVRRNGVPASLISGTPRLIRTHDDRATLEDRIGAFPTVLVCRDPIDSLVSFFHFRRDHRKAFDGTLSESIRHPTRGRCDWPVGTTHGVRQNPLTSSPLSSSRPTQNMHLARFSTSSRSRPRGRSQKLSMCGRSNGAKH